MTASASFGPSGSIMMPTRPASLMHGQTSAAWNSARTVAVETASRLPVHPGDWYTTAQSPMSLPPWASQ
eukprot:4130743-Pyramimonas_sp.AAC.1